MEKPYATLKTSAGIALLTMALLVIVSLVYYREKVLFADASYVVFNIINYKSLAIQFSRYGSFITQIVPFIGFKLHWPMRAILIAYAISFNLFYFVVALLLAYRYKQYGLCILFALFSCLFVSGSFYWISEIPQGIAWMFLLFGVTLFHGSRKSNIFWLIPSFLILSFLTIFTHFVIIIPTLFLWIYLIADGRYWPFSRRHTILLSGLLIGMIGLKFGIAMSGAQPAGEDMHLHGVTHISFRDIFDSFSRSVVRLFCYRCLTIYWPALIVFVLGIISLFQDGKKKLAAWVLLSLVGYIIIMGLTYATDDENTQLFHIESEWICIAIIAATPFVFSFLPKLKPLHGGLILGGIFTARLVYIFLAAAPFTWRIQFQEQVLSQMRKRNISKLALYRDPTVAPKYMLDWAAGYESVLLSASEGDQPRHQFIFINSDDKKMLDMLSKPQSAYFWDLIPPDRLNATYFNMDTSHPYQAMQYSDLYK